MPDGKLNDLTIYDAHAAEWWSDEVRWVRALKNMVPPRLRHFDRYVAWEGAEVLDLGCAGGFMAEALHDRGARVSAIDPAAEAVAVARAHAEATGREIAYAVGRGEALPYPDAAFDAVVCVDVLEHVEDWPTVLAEVARVLRLGGWFLFDTINRTAAARFAVVAMAEGVLRLLPRGTHDPALFIRPADIARELEGLGFVLAPLAGLGPVGVTRRGDPVFGRVPSRLVLYMGAARLTPPAT
jgi:2-polyprenyl-6-hydroxyphenyl methylase/3-demethylubiquinone-9 3-methyltransferase